MSKKPKPEGLFPAGFWDRPPQAKEGDADAAALFAAIGSALTAWEFAEEALAMLCLVFSETTDVNGFRAVRQLFGAIELSSGRRAALEQLSQVYFAPHQADPLIKKPFDRLVNAFSSGSRLRDDIAHGKVIDLAINNVKHGAYLVPSDYNSGRNFPSLAGGDELPFAAMRGKYCYNSASVASIRSRFEKLNVTVFTYMEFIRKIGGRLRPILNDNWAARFKNPKYLK